MPLTLPDGPVQICFSGGRTSGCMLHGILEAAGGALPPDWRVVFANTGLEFPSTLEFVHRCAMEWGVAIDWIEWQVDGGFRVVNHNSAARDGEPFSELIEHKGAIPNGRRRFCTDHLKITASNKFLDSLGWGKRTRALGFRTDEMHRAIPVRGRKYVNWYPLIDLGISIREVDAFWRAQPFDLDLPTHNGKTWLGNCDGCFLKSEANRAAFVRLYPERAQWWIDKEKYVTEKWGYKNVFSSNGVSYEELKNFVDRQGDWVFDLPPDEAVFCQASEGDCTG